MGHRWPAGAGAGVLAIGLVAACGAGSSAPDAASTVEPAVIEVGERSREAYARCVADLGGVPGDDGVSFQVPSGDPEVMRRVVEQCQPLLPATPELTDAEIRATYDRWLGEAECLREHGYDPDPAPTFETFLADWRGTGPWDPLTGVDTSSWTPELVRELKEECVLEFFHIG